MTPTTHDRAAHWWQIVSDTETLRWAERVAHLAMVAADGEAPYLVVYYRDGWHSARADLPRADDECATLPDAIDAVRIAVRCAPGARCHLHTDDPDACEIKGMP